MNRPNAAALAVSGLAAGFSIGCKRRRHVGRGGPAAVPAPHRLAGGAHVSRRLPRPGAGTLRAARARQSRSPTPVGATGRLVIPVPFRGRKRQADLGQLPRVRGQTPGLPRGASACDGGSRARPGRAIAGAGASTARGRPQWRAAAVATDGTRRRFHRRRAPCQLAVRRAPPPSNRSASERDDHRQSRHRRQVRDDRELHRRRTRVAGAVLRGPGRDVHRHGARGRGRGRRHVARVVPLRFGLPTGNGLRWTGRDVKGGTPRR